MTATDATLAGTLPAIIRSDDHRYTYKGVTYPGVTSILKVIDKSGALMTWAARETAEAAVALMESEQTFKDLYAAVGRDGVIKAVTNAHNWRRDEAAKLGSSVHDLADKYAKGTPLSELVGHGLVADYVRQYVEWFSRSGWKVRLSEACIVAPAEPGAHEGWGGTLDLLCTDPDGRTVLADIKTGKGIYRETILQLAAYGMAPLISPMGSPDVYAMPKIDRYVVLHVTRDGVREVEVSVGAREWAAWYAVAELARWIESVKGRL